MALPGRHHRGGGKLGPACGSVHLELDQACLEIVTDLKDLTFKAQSDECHACDLWTIGTDLHNGSYVKVNTTYGTWWQLSKAGGQVLCNESHVNFGQYGVYHLNVSDQHCHLEAVKDPSNPYLPILWAFLILGALQLSWHFGKKLYKYKVVPYCNARAVNQGSGLLDSDQNEEIANEVADAVQRSKLQRRVRSLDAFRGLAIVIMIFVNYGGGGYAFFAQ